MWARRLKWKFSARYSWTQAGLRWRGRRRSRTTKSRHTLLFAAKSRISPLRLLALRVGLDDKVKWASPHLVLPHFHFKLNNAFTWAVTSTVCGVNSSVSTSGAARAIADIRRAIMGATMRG